jgi:hypothetical protein
VPCHRAAATMRTPAEYRSEAQTYIQRAECAETDARAQRYVRMAESCQRLAELAEMVGPDAETAHRARSEPMYTGL